MNPPDILEPMPESTTQPSAFLWGGLTLMGLAMLICVASVLGSASDAGELIAHKEGWSPRYGLMMAGALLFGGGVLLYAQARYVFWRRTAGVVVLTSRERDAREIPTDRERRERKWDFLLFLNLALIAAIPRLIALKHSLWYDELWSLAFMRNGPFYAVTHQFNFNNHLLNSLLGSLCVQVYGLISGDTPITVPPAWVVRLPAFVFGIAAPPLLYATARRYMERPPAMAAAALLALSPTAIDFSAQSRGYSMLVFFAIAQAYWLGHALRSSSASSWLWWLTCCVLGVASHLSFAFVMLVDVLYLVTLALWVRRHLLDFERCQALIEQTCTLTAAWIFLTFASYVSILGKMRAENGRYADLEPMARAHELALPLLQVWGGVPSSGLLLPYYAAALALTVLGVWHLAKRPTGVAVYLSLFLVVPLLAAEILHPHFLYLRFFLFALPVFLILLTCGLWRLSVWAIGAGAARAGYHALALGALCMGFFVVTLPGLWQVIGLPKQDYQGVMEWMNDELSVGRVFYGINTGSEYFKPYAQERFKVAGLPTAQKQLGDYLKKKKLERKELRPEELWDMVRTFKSVYVLDTNLTVKPGTAPSKLVQAVHDVGRAPTRTFVGRFADWPSRWLDGDSDIQVYQLDAAHVPPPAPAPKPDTADTPPDSTAPQQNP